MITPKTIPLARAMHSPTPQLLRALRTSLYTLKPTPPKPSNHLQQTHHRTRTLAPSPFSHSQARSFTTSALRPLPSAAPSPTRSRGPPSAETTQTDFPSMDVLAMIPPPTTAIDACVPDGFHLDNGVKVTDHAGVLLVSGEAFAWRPWAVNGVDHASRSGSGSGSGKRSGMLNQKGQWEVGDGVWGVLEVMWPKPDLLILGLGASIYPLAPRTRRRINEMGVRVDVQDTRNAAAQFNLLATERGVSTVAAALIPVGWKGGE